jgi:hypothetical protein
MHGGRLDGGCSDADRQTGDKNNVRTRTTKKIRAAFFINDLLQFMIQKLIHPLIKHQAVIFTHGRAEGLHSREVRQIILPDFCTNLKRKISLVKITNECEIPRSLSKYFLSY